MTVFGNRNQALGHKKGNSLKLWLSFFCLSFARARTSASKKIQREVRGETESRTFIYFTDVKLAPL